VSSRLQWWFDSALLVLPGVIWGASFLFIAEGLEAVGPYGLAFLRIAIGFAVLSLFPAARRAVPASEIRGTVALGVVWMAVPLTMFALAEQHVSSALTGMLNGATPLFVAVVAAAMAGRLPSSATRIGLAVGFVGAVVMAVPGLGTGQSSMLGVLEILVALMCYGLALNIARGLQQRNGALPVIWRAQGMALLLTAPLGLPEVFEARWSLEPLLALLALGALGTALAYVAAATAAGRLGATRASATTFLIPPVALVLGVLVRDEHVQLVSVLGAGVCLVGAWVLRRAQSDAAVKASAPSRTAAPAAAEPLLARPHR
jgi:drug/metabolite transporter (DMT)-like permease